MKRIKEQKGGDVKKEIEKIKNKKKEKEKETKGKKRYAGISDHIDANG